MIISAVPATNFTPLLCRLTTDSCQTHLRRDGGDAGCNGGLNEFAAIQSVHNDLLPKQRRERSQSVLAAVSMQMSEANGTAQG